MTKRRSNQGFSVLKRGKRCHARFKDQHGIWRWVAAYGDADASMELARKLRRLSEYRAAGQAPDDTLAKWIDGLAGELLAKLAGWGIIDAPAGQVPLSDHIQAWHASILADGSRLATADQARLYVDRMVEALQVEYFDDIDPQEVKLWRSKLTCKTETKNHHVRSVKQFCRWMVDTERATRSPVAGRKVKNLKILDKRVRRALSDEDFQRLITATENAREAFGLTGPQRATMYWLAARTGFRANEIRSLTAGSFQLDASPPLVTVKASHTKNGNMAVQVIPPGLVPRMRQHLQTMLPSMPAFKIPKRSADMIRLDLERAGIPAVDDSDEHYDFHALRVQYGTDMVRSGLSPAVVQKRMRHSDPKLTMNIYTKLGIDFQGQALEALPQIKIG